MMHCFELYVISKITFLIFFVRHEFGLLPSLSFPMRCVMFVVFLSGLLGVVAMKLPYVAMLGV